MLTAQLVSPTGFDIDTIKYIKYSVLGRQLRLMYPIHTISMASRDVFCSFLDQIFCRGTVLSGPVHASVV